MVVSQLPEEVLEAWEKRDPVAVFTTVDDDGVPNSVYVSCCGLEEGPRVLICDMKFGKTLVNVQQGKRQCAFLFFAPDLAAYQLKGPVRYATEGDVFERGKAYAKPDLEARGMVEMEVTEVYKGSDRLM